jgi:hypothetical protein
MGILQKQKVIVPGKLEGEAGSARCAVQAEKVSLGRGYKYAKIIIIDDSVKPHLPPGVYRLKFDGRCHTMRCLLIGKWIKAW